MTFFNRQREWYFYMEEIFSLNNNLLINNDVSLNGNLNVKNINTIDLSVNNILKTKHLDVYGNLTVHGTQTIINSEVLNVDDNIIIVNADGEFIQQAGLQANIEGNLYGLLYDTNINAWTINNKNLYLNKLVGNNIELTENVTASWFNGNLSGTNASLSNNVTAQWFNGNLSGTNAILRENVTASWFNGNLSGTNASLSNNVTAQWFNGNLSGTNAILRENVTASWFNGNLSGTNAILRENVTASWFNGNLSGTNATLTENVTASWFNGNLSGTNASLSNNVNASWFNGNLSGTNAILRENVTAQWFNGNLSGTNAYLSNNVNASWFNGNLSGINATLTENVNASWFNGNLSGTNATLTENVNASWFNGNLSGTNAYLSNNVNASWFNGNLSGINATLRENVNASWFNGNLSGTNASLSNNVNASWFNGNLSGTNAILRENVTASWFNGNLSGTNATLTENVNASWFNGNLSGTNAILTENVTASWFNGNLSGTNASLSNNVTAQWFNGNLSGTNAILRESLTANTIHVNELHLAPNTLYIDNKPILYSHNGNLLMSIDLFHGDLTGNLISKNIFVNGNIIIGNNFGIKFNDGTTITSGNISSTSGGGGTSNVTSQEIDDRISNYLFNKPEAPTDSSGIFHILTDNTGTYPTITLQWSNPMSKRVAFSFGTTPGYDEPKNNNPLPEDRNNFNLNKNIKHLPYSKELKIEFREENNASFWDNLTLHSDGKTSTQYIIPNTVITANINSSGNTPTLIANTVSNTYTEFKSGKGLKIGNNYQFRIYLTNEITEQDGSYNYLYIPSETEYIAFGGFANVTAPTEILFPVNNFYNLQIKGINGNIYAETGMNTAFPISENYDLRVRYGFDIDIRANVNSKQMPNERANTNSGKFITGDLSINTFTENISFVSSLRLTNGDNINWYPEFDYNISNFFMEANLDIVGNIAQTTIGNTITTIRPIRQNVGASIIFLNNLSTNDYTSYFSSNSFGMTKSNIYKYNSDERIDNIYILDNTETFDLTFNPNIKVINNSDDYIGLDSSGEDLCYFNSNIVNYDITERFNDETNDSKGFLQITNINSTANIIVTGAIEDSSTYNITKGYYTDINLTQIGVNNINLSRFPDICNNNYQKYKVNVNQNVNFSNGFENKGTIYFDFGVAEKSANNITFNFNLDNFLNLTLNDKFYGIPRPNTNYSSNKPEIRFNYTFFNVNNFWRRNLNIIENINVKLLNNSITFTDTNNSKNWTTEIYNPGILQFNRNIENTTWNIITNSTNNNYFSRYNGTNPQFNITFNVNNNIGFSNTLSNNENFNWDNSNDVLWWDYTWGINNNIPSSVFSKPSSLTIQLCESINPFTSGNTIPNLFNHHNKITYESAMWSKDGWCGANITIQDDYNPYIDYREYNLITDVSYDYSIFDNSGTQQTVNYGLNIYSGSSTSQIINFNNLKWVIFKLYNSTQNTNNLQFDTNLTWLTDYIVFYLEEDYNSNSGSYTIVNNGSTITSSKTFWLDSQNISVNSAAIMNFITGQAESPVGSNNGCNAGDSGESIKVINRFRGGNSLINQYIAFGIKPGKKLKTITFSYV